MTLKRRSLQQLSPRKVIKGQQCLVTGKFLEMFLQRRSIRMPDIDADDVGRVLGRRDKKATLQELLKHIVEHDCRDLHPQREDVARSWRVITTYIESCGQIQVPRRPEGADWRSIAEAEAHYDSFRQKVLWDRSWKDIFPLGEFCRAWGAARQEFLAEVAEVFAYQQMDSRFDDEALGTLMHQFTFETGSQVLRNSVSDIDEAEDRERSLTCATVITFADRESGYYSCHTGWSDAAPPDRELTALQLNEEASSYLGFTTQLRDRAAQLLSELQNKQEETRSLLLADLSESHSPSSHDDADISSGEEG